MMRNEKLVLLLVAASVGLWGCSKVTSTSTREGERLKFLEAKVAKLEEDFRTVAAARDLWKQKAGAIEKERAELDKQVPILTRERDELRAQLNARTSERDNLQAQYDNFRKEIRTLLGHADAAAVRPASSNQQPVTAVTTLMPGRS
jgi:chromosome segregation ATPase